MPDLIGENNAPTPQDTTPDTDAGAAPHPDVADAVTTPVADVQGAGTAGATAADGAEAVVGTAEEAAQGHAPHDAEADLVAREAERAAHNAAGLAAQAEANKGFGVPPDDHSDFVPPHVGTADDPHPADPALTAQAAEAVVITTAAAFDVSQYVADAPADTTGLPAADGHSDSPAVDGADAGLAYAAASHSTSAAIDPLGIGQFGDADVGALDAGQPPVDPLIDFILQQLNDIEALGFLRGSIIWIAGRMGTPGAQPGDSERLNAFNLAFQYRLREFKIKSDAAQLDYNDKLLNQQAGADADAQKRGWRDAADMTRSLQALYVDVSERLRAWHKATEPGGDPTSAPDIDRLLYDAWRIVEGVPQATSELQ